MKSKKTTYLLLGAVILIWVFVFIRVFDFLKEDASESSFNKSIKRSERTDENINDNFHILANYRDPFLGNVNNGSNVLTKRIIKTTIDPSEKIKFDFVSFHGTIINTESRKKIALVNINGKEFMVSEGEKIEGISFIKNLTDSIKVSYTGKIYYLRRN